MSLDDVKAASTLGERLLVAVRNIWRELNNQTKIITSQGTDLAALEKRVLTLEKELKRLRISKGVARAKSAKLQDALLESTQKIAEIKALLH